ncbi:hypothetical protein HDV01_004356 [Terramyces sp. JEL0728]|nr:hypothetical protein HDV01_004356 [Terramyces sp. JEL0728]
MNSEKPVLPNDQIHYQPGAMKNMEPLDPNKRGEPNHTDENNEVDRRSFFVKALPSLLGILLCAIVTFASYLVLPGDTDNLTKIQQEFAEGNVKLGQWNISVHSLVAAIVTIQGMLLGLAVTIATPLLTWYYITKFGVPYTFLDSSKSIVGNLQTLKNGDFKPYVFVSIIYIVATIFRSTDNIALSSFISHRDIYEPGLVPVINVANIYDFDFYRSIITSNPAHEGSDSVYREGSQPFHSAVGAISNGYSIADASTTSGSTMLTCKENDCSAEITIFADYNMTCDQLDVKPINSSKIQSRVYGIFGEGPELDDGSRVYYRIGAQSTVRIDNNYTNPQTAAEVKCTIFSAKTTRMEDSKYGTWEKDVLSVYSVPTESNTTAFGGYDVLSPYNTSVPYTGADFPIADPSDITKTPLPYYFMGSFSLMLQRSATGVCDYDSAKRVDKCGDNGNFLFDFPFELNHDSDDIQNIMMGITEKYYQNMYMLRFDHNISKSVLVDGYNYYDAVVTNKVSMMTVIGVFNLFSISILIAAIVVISLVHIPIKLGVLQLSILSYRSKLFEGEQFSSEQQLREKFVVKVVEHDGMFWLQRQDR